jgi:hypothetical protein
MRATQLLHSLGQSLWLDNLTAELSERGTLKQTRRCHVCTNPRSDEWCRWMGVSGSVAAVGSRDSNHAGCRQSAACPSGPAQSADQDPGNTSVASFFVSRWDAAVMDKVSKNLRGRLGIAVAKRICKHIACCSVRRAGNVCTTQVRGPSVSCGRAREQKIHMLATFNTSKHWPRPSP